MRGAFVLAIAVTACKGNAPAPPPMPSGSASASASAAAVETEAGPVAAAEVDAATEDAGEEGGTAVTAKDGSPIPPLAKGAAWSIVRWDMSRADIEDAFKKAGTAVEGKTDAKTGSERVTVRHGAWNGVVYFSAKKPTSIVVTGEHLSKDTAGKVRGKVEERAGAPTQTMDRHEVRWRKAGAGTTTVVVANDGTVREEYVRDGGAGEVGFAKLTWGMAPAAVKDALVAAGYGARITTQSGGLDPCSLPNAPPGCERTKAPPESVVVTKGDREGKASFDQKGLTQIEMSGPSTDKGAAILAAVEKTLGKPSSREKSTKTQHADDVAKIELEVKEKEPEGTFTVFESYRPKR
jgi:hypothetical protein